MKKNLNYLLRILFFLVISCYVFSLSAYANLKEYTIGPQDILRIEVWDNPDLAREAAVSTKGNISFPLIGEIYVEGLTSEQLQDIICSRLADGFLVNPQVTVTIKEYNSQKIYVLGEVKRSGNYPLSKAATLVEIISMAGGFTPEADQEAYIWRSSENNTKSDQGRRKNGHKENAPPIEIIDNDLSPDTDIDLLIKNALENQFITIDLSDFNKGINLNFRLQNNDIIYIPKAKFFYVMGEVRMPGRYKLEKEVNLLQAISMAGGLTQKANKKKIEIVRTIKGETQEIATGMMALVLPGDIIKVSESFF